MSKETLRQGEFQEGLGWFQYRGHCVILGVTEAALEGLGNLQAVELPAVGDELSLSETAVILQGEETQFELTTPISGRVVDRNEALQIEPQWVLEDPREQGWLIQLEVKQFQDLQFLGLEESSSEQC